MFPKNNSRRQKRLFGKVSQILRSIKAALPLEIEIKIDERVKDYLKNNYGAPFIIVFMALLIYAAIYLAYGKKAIADQLAVYAYYMLVIGVIGQIIAYIRNRDKEQKDEIA